MFARNCPNETFSKHSKSSRHWNARKDPNSFAAYQKKRLGPWIWILKRSMWYIMQVTKLNSRFSKIYIENQNKIKTVTYFLTFIYTMSFSQMITAWLSPSYSIQLISSMAEDYKVHEIYNLFKTFYNLLTCGTIVNFGRRSSSGTLAISIPSIKIRPLSASIIRNNARVKELFPATHTDICNRNKA